MLSDEMLVLKCRSGDNDAWETLVHRYQRLIYAIPRRSGLGEDLAAEVFQRVFATLVEKIDRIENPSRLGAWLVTTARRETWRLSRRESTYRPFPGDSSDSDIEFEVPDNAPLPGEDLQRLEAQHSIRTAVANLDERCRTLLTLLFFRAETPPYADIAAQLGTSEGSIGPTRARCLQKMRRLLEESGFGADGENL